MEKDKPTLKDIVNETKKEKLSAKIINGTLSGVIGTCILDKGFQISKIIYQDIQANAPQIQEYVGKLGYDVVEKSFPLLMGLSFVAVAYIGTRATYTYLKEKRPVFFKR